MFAFGENMVGGALMNTKEEIINFINTFTSVVCLEDAEIFLNIFKEQMQGLNREKEKVRG